MDLFEHFTSQPENLLPEDGEAYYFGPVLSREKSDYFFETLSREIQWENDKAIIFGKEIITKRKVAWYGEKNFSYTYSKVTKTAKPWTLTLLEIKEIAELVCGETFNSCLLNLYHDGSEGMAWHSDGEKDLKKNGAIGSFSFGAQRKFSFKHKKTKQRLSKDLEHGSFLVMKGLTQTHWLHSLPPTKLSQTPRINLTFRTIIE